MLFLLDVTQYAVWKEPEYIQFKDKPFHTSKEHFTVTHTQRTLRDKINQSNKNAVR